MLRDRRLEHVDAEEARQRILDVAGDRGDGTVAGLELCEQLVLVTRLEVAPVVVHVDAEAQLAGAIEQANQREVRPEKVRDAAAGGERGVLRLAPRAPRVTPVEAGGNARVAVRRDGDALLVRGQSQGSRLRACDAHVEETAVLGRHEDGSGLAARAHELDRARSRECERGLRPRWGIGRRRRELAHAADLVERQCARGGMELRDQVARLYRAHTRS
jgi:hypothetical protein